MATAEMALAVSRALSQGYQIDSDAFSLLSELSGKGDVEPILKSVIEKKESLKADRVILKSDFDEFVPKHESSRIALDPADLAADLVIMSDPTDSIARIVFVIDLPLIHCRPRRHGGDWYHNPTSSIKL